MKRVLLSASPWQTRIATQWSQHALRPATMLRRMPPVGHVDLAMPFHMTRRSLHASNAIAASPKYTNRLSTEKSPYLLQHAHNPVDWYPWGKEAFQKAQAENKPIFLSVGYSTCHWCHVMEHESFENEEIAKLMNEHFVNIKVDREENPGVDKLYMVYVQLTAGRGGWPMSVFLTPDLHPFFGATYFPPDDYQGKPGFKTLIKRITHVWATSPDGLRENGRDTINQLQAFVSSRPSQSILDTLDSKAVASDAYEHYATSFDDKQGGFGDAPKFPQPVQLSFLLDYYGYMRNKPEKADDAQKALDMALFTLKRIAAGGIHDHVAGGFHRYSTDEYWHVPHFEKMLYDQAQLLSAYATAYQITKDQVYANVAKDILLYLARNLQHSEGGFYSAEDADSLSDATAIAKTEGAFYVWEKDELASILDDTTAALVSAHYGVQNDGNVSSLQDPHNELVNKNVLSERATIEETANKMGITVDVASSILDKAKLTLREYRERNRPKPHCDDKIITSWNGLMISGLVQAFRIFQDPGVLEMATRTASFIQRELYNPSSNTLLRSYREGPSSIEGFLDDYSFLIQGLLDLYESTFDEQWVQFAHQLQEKQNELFYDEVQGGYFGVRKGDPSILVRLKEEQDGAEPSANGVSLKNLIRLGTLLEDPSYVKKAQDTLESFHVAMSRFPYAMPSLVDCFLLMSEGVKQIVLAGDGDDPKMKDFERMVSQVFIPNKVVARAIRGSVVSEKNATMAQIASQDRPTPSAYICEHFTCGLPISEIGQLRKQLMDKDD